MNAVTIFALFYIYSDASKYSESRFSESKYSESKYAESNYSDSMYSESASASMCAPASVSASLDTKYKSVMVVSEEKDECVIATEVSKFSTYQPHSRSKLSRMLRNGPIGSVCQPRPFLHRLLLY